MMKGWALLFKGDSVTTIVISFINFIGLISIIGFINIINFIGFINIIGFKHEQQLCHTNSLHKHPKNTIQVLPYRDTWGLHSECTAHPASTPSSYRPCWQSPHACRRVKKQGQ